MSIGSKPLILKNPNAPARVIIIGRVSKLQQNIENIDASYRYDEEYLRKLHQGPTEIKYLGEQGSGMRTDRLTIMEAEEEIATGTWDLVITEDLSRFYRNPRHQYAFVQDAVDHGTRVICIGDNLDTADENWEVAMGTASLRHSLHIPDTRRRVRRTATDSFHKGGMVQKFRFGYRKLTKEEAGSGLFGPVGLRIAKVPECTPIIREMKAMIMNGRKYVELADWLIENQIKPGPYVTSETWSDNLVRDFLRDPILRGMRTFRDVLHQPIFLTGKYRRQKNTDEAEMKEYPELAHFTPAEHFELLEEMDRRAREHFTPKEGKSHPLVNRPRSRTLWPGQHMRCGICGGLFYWCSDDQLKCQNALKHGPERCWNHVQVAAEQVRVTVIRWILSEFERFPSFLKALLDSAWQEYARTLQKSKGKERALDDEIRELEKQSAKLAKAVRMTEEQEIESLVQELTEVNDSLVVARKRKKLEQDRINDPLVLGSRSDFVVRPEEGMLSLSRSSYEFCDLMRQMIPEFVIYPVQAIDTGLVRPRGRITMRPSGLLEAKGAGAGDLKATLDLFPYPVYVPPLQACLAEKEHNPKMTLKAIAAKLGINHMTVKRAFDLYRRMQEEGLDDPYRELQAEPVNASRWTKRPQ
jgi:site-specific DNA recombinase